MTFDVSDGCLKRCVRQKPEMLMTDFFIDHFFHRNQPSLDIHRVCLRSCCLRFTGLCQSVPMHESLNKAFAMKSLQAQRKKTVNFTV